VVRFRFQEGIREDIRYQLQVFECATLQSALDKALILEKTVVKKEKDHFNPRRPTQTKKKKFSGNCFNCGISGHKVSDCRKPCGSCGAKGHIKKDCPDKEKPQNQQQNPPQQQKPPLCKNCGKRGHLTKDCRGKNEVNILVKSKSDGLLYAPVQINGVVMEGLLDSGASVSVISFDAAEEIGLEFDPSKKEEMSTAGTSVYSLGVATTSMSCDGITKEVRLQVIDNFKYPLLIGLDIFRIFNALLDSVKGTFTVNTIQVKPQPQFATVKEALEVRWNSPSDHLDDKQCEALLSVLNDFNDVFVDKAEECIGSVANVEPMKITLMPDKTQPIFIPQWKLPFKDEEALRNQIPDLLRLKIIRDSKSSWNFPVVMAAKKDGTLRKCLNVKKLNDVSVKERLPLPTFEDIVNRMGGCKYFSTMDAMHGYWQMPLDKESSQYLAFTVPGVGGGHYEYCVTPFGPTNAPGAFQKRFAESLKPELGVCVESMLDDAIVHSKNWEDHLQALRRVLTLIRKANWKMKRKKCSFGQIYAEVLGHIISLEGVKQNPKKTQKMLQIIQIHSRKDLRSWISFIGYYQKFIPHFSDSAQVNYSTGEKETLAIVTALEKYWYYIKGSPVTVY
jgi:hypothetical protein